MVRPYVTGVLPVTCCIEPAGASPARVSAGAPGSRVQLGGESRTAERTVKSLVKEGAKERAATSSEACSLVRLSAERRMGGPSRSFRGEGDGQRRRTGGSAGTPRGRERGTFRRLDAEQERPCSAASRRRKDPVHKAEAESAGSRGGVRGVRSTDEGGRHKPPEGRGPALVVRAMEVSARA